jgi:hypothetical protein
LQGNVDYREWYLGEHINFPRDTDKVMKAFFEFCHQAGPERCRLYAKSPAEVQARLSSIIENLKTHPVIVPASDEGPELPELVTYSKVKRLLTSVLYQPLRAFHRLAEVLAALEQGDGQPYYQLVNSDAIPPSAYCGLKPIPPTIPLDDSLEDNNDAFPAILCADGQPFDQTVEQFEDYANQVQEISPSTGAVTVSFRLSCAGRTIRPKWRFTGPFVADTSFPILFVANMADNITPLVSARNNSQGFKDSVILIQNSYGVSLVRPSFRMLQ